VNSGIRILISDDATFSGVRGGKRSNKAWHSKKSEPGFVFFLGTRTVTLNGPKEESNGNAETAFLDGFHPFLFLWSCSLCLCPAGKQSVSCLSWVSAAMGIFGSSFRNESSRSASGRLNSRSLLVIQNGRRGLLISVN
jgi:hypothetical protein